MNNDEQALRRLSYKAVPRTRGVVAKAVDEDSIRRALLKKASETGNLTDAARYLDAIERDRFSKMNKGEEET